MSFTLLGEFLILLIWGVYLFPGGVFFHKAVWAGTCGLAMGATIGAAVNLVVTGRRAGRTAAILSSTIYFMTLALCTILCFQIDRATGSQFGALQAPVLFVAGGLIPAFATSIVYSWLLYSKAGANLLSRLGL